MITSLSDDIILDILARVPICDYTTLSIVSKHFHTLVASCELYARRALLGCTESYIYALPYNLDTKECRLYVLRRKGNIGSFVPIQSLLPMPCDASFVAEGSKIYVLGGNYGNDMTTNALSIDCKSHTVQPLPSLPMKIFSLSKVADIVDGKIYLIGDKLDDESDDDGSSLSKTVMVFDTETQTWEHEMIKLGMKLGYIWDCVVMANKIYLRDHKNSFVYGPKESRWELDEMLNSKVWLNVCVIDNVLYRYDPFWNKLRTYDPNLRRWGVVKGLEELFGINDSYSSHTVSYGGKLAVFLFSGETEELWCAEIAIEKRQGGEIWGKLEWRGVVLNANGDLFLTKVLTVMV